MGKKIWMLSGAILAVVLVSLLGFAGANFSAAYAGTSADSTANNPGTGAACPMHSGAAGAAGMMGMMQSGSTGMINMMNGAGHADCMSMDAQQMDKDNDGVCDYCGMKVEDCGKMSEMHNEMHGSSNDSGNEEMPSCGMHSNGNGMQSGMMGMGMH